MLTNLVYFLRNLHRALRDIEEIGEFDAKCYTLFAKLIDKLSNTIPILDVMEHLISDYCSVAWLEVLAQVFINSTSFTRQDKIIALELIGCYLISTMYIFHIDLLMIHRQRLDYSTGGKPLFFVISRLVVNLLSPKYPMWMFHLKHLMQFLDLLLK